MASPRLLLLRTAVRAAMATSGTTLPQITANICLPACTQAVARLPWRSSQTWASQQYRNYASQEKNNADAAASQEAASSSDPEAADSTAGADQAAADEQAGSVELTKLQELLKKAEEEAASFKDRWQRSHAEMANLIERQKREKETMQTYAVQKFAQELLSVADNLESAAKAVPKEVMQPGAELSAEKALAYLKSLLEGVQATEKVLLKTMASKGVERIGTAEGDAFDPNTQEAMSTMPASSESQKPGTVAAVWQSGYKMHDRILRAAKVIVFQE